MAPGPILWVSVVATLLGALQYGYAMGVLNTVLGTISFELGFDYKVGGAVVTSIMLLGAAAGALGSGIVADTIGPKKAQMVNVVFLVVGGAVSAVTSKRLVHWNIFGFEGRAPIALLLGRLTTGLGCGCASLFVPRYIAEISPAAYRGSMSGWFQVMVNVGILSGYLIGLPYTFDYQELRIRGLAISWWRIMLAAAIIPAVLQLGLFTFCPESPVWLEWRGRKSEAASVRRALWGDFLMTDDNSNNCSYSYSDSSQQSTSPRLYNDAVSGACPSICNASCSCGPSGMCERDRDDLMEALLPKDEGEIKQGAVEGWSCLIKKKYRWMVILAIGIPVLQQLSGINTVVLYSAQIFKTAGFTDSRAGTIYTGLDNLFFTVLAAPLADRVGRRPLLLWSYAGMGLCLACLASSTLGNGVVWLHYVALAAVLFFMVFFALGSGPISWIYLAEILPENIKGRVASLATALSWVFNLVIATSFPAMMDCFGIGRTYFIYAGFNVLAVIFIYFLMIETKRQTLDEIVAKLLLVE